MACPIIIPCFLEIKITLLKSAAAERLEHESGITVLLSKNEITWSDPGKELIINGELFDVAEVIQTEEGFKFKGVFDGNETAFQHKAADLFEKETQKNDPVFLKCFQLLNDIYFSAPDNLLTQAFIFSRVTYPELCLNGQSAQLSEISPPPKMIMITS